ncbi:MAG: hypothetical protein M3448_09675, partial [Pseudomonadota bacterium]|nr:hypothetical protein [Pseudomonadota bacterium]
MDGTFSHLATDSTSIMHFPSLAIVGRTFTAVSGPRRPNAARALCEESLFGEQTCGATRAPFIFFRSLPEAAW